LCPPAGIAVPPAVRNVPLLLSEIEMLCGRDWFIETVGKVARGERRNHHRIAPDPSRWRVSADAGGSPVRILITGARGFIGQALRRRLESRGHVVHGTVCRSSPGERDVRIDLTRDEDYAALPCGPFDAVIHAAGVMSGPPLRDDACRVNAEG